MERENEVFGFECRDVQIRPHPARDELLDAGVPMQDRLEDPVSRFGDAKLGEHDGRHHLLGGRHLGGENEIESRFIFVRAGEADMNDELGRIAFGNADIRGQDRRI